MKVGIGILAEAVREALQKIGVVGELDVRMDGSRLTSWIGEPGGDDVIVTVTMEAAPTAKDEAA